MKETLKKVFAFFASYGLACVLFILLFAITFVGTLEQVDHGIYDVQKKYFESVVAVYWIFDAVPVPLPGVYLLLILLSINIFCGGIIQMRKGWRTLGILIGHTGILVLLASGLIKHEFANDGYMSLHEGERAQAFESYHEWELVIWKDEADTVTEYIIPDAAFSGGRLPRTLTDNRLPFGLTVEWYYRNCTPLPGPDQFGGAGPRIDGVALAPLPKSVEAEQNIPGLYLRVTPVGAEPKDTLLWGQAVAPYAFQAGDDTWAIDLRRKRWHTPFSVELIEFRRKLHPGTNLPAEFSSEVRAIDEYGDQRIRISMNQPMRYRGHTLYQASWGPQNAPPGTPLFSVFAVARDPAEDLPLIACVIITVGLVLHFALMLANYLRRETKRART